MEVFDSRNIEPIIQRTRQRTRVRAFGRVTGLISKPNQVKSKFIRNCLAALEEYALNFPSSSLIVTVCDGTLKAHIVKR